MDLSCVAEFVRCGRGYLTKKSSLLSFFIPKFAKNTKMGIGDLDLNKPYTYADYCKWKFDDRVELIKGKIFEMGAATPVHQRISGRIFIEIGQHLKGKTCEVFLAPFDVRLPRRSKNDEDITTVFQSDICVISDPTKIDDRGCIGAPDIVIEILSPANNKKELKYKYEVCEEAGVLEYWIVDPREKAMQIFLLASGKLVSHGYLYEEDKVTSAILPGFSLNIGDLFEKN